MILVICVALLLTACTSAFEARYPDECVLAKTDPESKSTVVSNFPCRLRQIGPSEQKAP